MRLAIAKTVYKVSDFLSWQRAGSLVISPSFQRRSVWPKAAKSFLIDTVVRGLPMPIIFLREQTDLHTLEPVREVIDGQQRLRTLISFIEPSLLKDFNSDRDAFTVKRTHNSDIAGRTFRNLEPEVRRHILNYEFSAHVLPSDTDDREVLQIFARMNATGIKVNAQELRNAEYFGAFKTLVYDLAYEQLGRWRTWKVFSETDIARMQEVEETSDIILTMTKGVHGKNQPALDKLYADNEEEFPHADETSRRFRFTMDAIEDTFGEDIRASVFSRKAIFHTLFTLYYHLLYGLGSKLQKEKPKALPKRLVVALKNASDQITGEELEEDLAKALRGATSDLKSRRLRFEFLLDILEDATA
jgi:hypothetical protein